MKIALTQFAPKPGQLDANRERACDRVREAAACGCDLVVFPELFTVGYFAFDAYEAAAEALDGETVGMLSAVADEHDIAVLTGTFIEDLNATTSVDTPADTGLANTAVLLNRSGEIRLWYRKQHLFGYQSEEADRLVAGETIETAPLRGATVGITTCYDLRFPELYRAF